MPRLGDGTTTDTTNTSNEIKFAGDSFFKKQTISRRVGTSTSTTYDLTGYQPSVIAELVAPAVDDQFGTVFPVGSCTVNATTTSTIESNCSGVWVENPNYSLEVQTTELSEGAFSFYYPNNLLRKVGLVSGEEPKIGDPSYVRYTVRVQQSDGSQPIGFNTVDNVIAFRSTPAYKIASIWVTATVYTVGTVVFSPSDDNDYTCIVETTVADVTDPSGDAANWKIKN